MNCMISLQVHVRLYPYPPEKKCLSFSNTSVHPFFWVVIGLFNVVVVDWLLSFCCLGVFGYFDLCVLNVSIVSVAFFSKEQAS